ncbi:MAG: cyanophycinase [Actinomycetota bacterium]|jgi:cyanophycinase|nr:cyanophycinase [Actinomycetota bacterium]MDQ1500281.1 cyanophycinase [Actinomycetota bacterium]MDQ1505124.1 cyanophycinase [Actinomycetota bacterium]
MNGDGTGTLALVGGAEWQDGCRKFDAALLEASGTDEVLVLPTAAAFENPRRAVETARRYFDELGANVSALMVLGRREAEDDTNAAVVRGSRFVYIGGGSPMHLRSVLKGSRLWEALVEVWNDGAVLAASSAGAMVLCDPMVDPRGGAYTVGLGLLSNMPIFPHHDTAPAHLRERSIELRPDSSVLVGIDEQTALLRDPDGSWRVAGQGTVTIYGPTRDEVAVYASDATVEGLPPE